MTTAERKKRDKMISKLVAIAKGLANEFSRAKYDKMWTMCSDWNSEHEEAEIFMCEDEDENGKFRYFIEDDYFYPAD